MHPQKNRQVQTGEGFNYTFTIGGTGNISAMQAPVYKTDEQLLLYPPQLQQQIHRAQGRVFGEKSFTYHILPQKAGTYLLKDRLEWVYFDPTRVRYDTLHAPTVLTVTGADVRDSHVNNYQEDTFYQSFLGMQATDTWFKTPWNHWVATVVGLITLLCGGVGVLKGYKKKKLQKNNPFNTL